MASEHHVRRHQHRGRALLPRRFRRAGPPPSRLPPEPHSLSPRGDDRPSAHEVSAAVATHTTNVAWVQRAVRPALVRAFEQEHWPAMSAAGVGLVAAFVTETAAHDLPRTQVHEDQYAVVWLARARAGSFAGADPSSQAMGGALGAIADTLRLAPTSASRLR